MVVRPMTYNFRKNQLRIDGGMLKLSDDEPRILGRISKACLNDLRARGWLKDEMGRLNPPSSRA
jgi:hypothetical protein